jgi:hypothetical protein
MTPLIRSYMNAVISADFDPTEMQWFDISNIGQMNAVGISKLATHRPPFDKNLILWTGSTKNHKRYEFSMLVAGTDPEEGIVIDITKGEPGKYSTFPPLVYIVDDGQVKYGPVNEEENIPQDVAELMLSVVAVWYDELDTGCKSYKPVIKKTFTNKRKIAQGKLPTYDWTTVVIEPAKERSEFKGGTHASPRQHDRRGHIRRLRGGKNVWVKAHKVGDASKGYVFHDYEIRSEKVTQ